MNVFVLDEDPIKAAQMLCDRHLIKMQLESAQLMSTAYFLLSNTYSPDMYVPTHRHHPCTVMLTKSAPYIAWLYKHAEGMVEEQQRRWGHQRAHASFAITEHAYQQLKALPQCPQACDSQLLIPLAMPADVKGDLKVAPVGLAVILYRAYYNKHKRHLFSWKNTKVPYWVEQQVNDKV